MSEIEWSLKNNPNTNEFCTTSTTITDKLRRRAKRVAKIRSLQEQGDYKNADSRRREASHKKYEIRAMKIRGPISRSASCRSYLKQTNTFFKNHSEPEGN